MYLTYQPVYYFHHFSPDFIRKWQSSVSTRDRFMSIRRFLRRPMRRTTGMSNVAQVRRAVSNALLTRQPRWTVRNFSGDSTLYAASCWASADQPTVSVSRLVPKAQTGLHYRHYIVALTVIVFCTIHYVTTFIMYHLFVYCVFYVWLPVLAK